MTSCELCELIIEKENEFDSIVKCLMCKKPYHPKCVGYTKAFLKTLAPFRNFSWFCDSCNKTKDSHMSVLDRLKSVEESFDKKMSDQKSEIAKLKKIVEQLVNKKCDDISTPRGLNVKRPYSEVLRDGVMDVNNVWQTPLTTGIRWSDEMSSNKSNKSAAVYSNDGSGNKPKRHKAVSSVPAKRDPVLIVKAKSSPDKKKVKESVQKVLHPVKDPVRLMKETAGGDVILICNDAESVNVVKKKVDEAIGSSFDVSEPKELQPRLKIVGFEPDYCDNNKFLDAFSNQNKDIVNDEAQFELIQDPKQQLSGKRMCTAIIGVDMNTFKRALTKQKVYIGWSSCAIYEQVDVVRCFKCQEYNHISANCKSASTVCCFCSESHDGVKECPHKGDDKSFKCANCYKANAKYGLNIDVNHSVMSLQCPVLRKKIEQKKKNIRYKA